MQQVLLNSASRPVTHNICRDHRHFGNAADPRRCNNLCIFQPLPRIESNKPSTTTMPQKPKESTPANHIQPTLTAINTDYLNQVLEKDLLMSESEIDS